MATRPLPPDDAYTDSPDQPVEDSPDQPVGTGEDKKKQERVTDEQSEESFPASDAPAW